MPMPVGNTKAYPEPEGGPEDHNLALRQSEAPSDDLLNEDTQGSDVEFIIMNLYSKMKNLEGKYIDLANFYKQELVKSNKKAPPPMTGSNFDDPLQPRNLNQHNRSIGNQ
jgi:hypothetical protein